MKKILTAAALLLALFLPLSALADAELDRDVTTYGGQTTIRWSSSETPSGGFTVIAEALNSGSGSETLLQLAGTSSRNSLTTGILAPGRRYRVYLLDGSYNILDTEEYTMRSVPAFEDGLLKDTSIKVTFEQRTTNLSSFKKVNSFRSSDMAAGISAGSQYPCMKYQMQMPQLAYARTFFVQLVFEAPNGIAFTDRAQDVTFDRVNNGYQTLWWDDAGIDFFDKLYSKTDTIPAGEYKIHLYWDGYWVKTSSFRVY